VLGFVVNGFSAAHITMTVTNCSATPSYLQFNVMVTNDGDQPLSFNSCAPKVTFAAGILPATGTNTLTPTYVGGSDFPLCFATFGSTGTYNFAPIATGTRIFNMTMSTASYTAGSAVQLPIGVAMNVGTFRITNVNSLGLPLNAGVSTAAAWSGTTSGCVLYLAGASTTFNATLPTATSRTLGAVCSSTIPSSCTAPTLAITSTNISGCAGSTHGDINLSTTGGSAPFSYLWSNGAQTQNLTGVLAGTYTVTVTATGGCTASTSGTILDGPAATTYYADVDGDGFGNAASTIQSCTGAPLGYVSNNTDCNDNNSAIHPGAPEVCNGIDDNCDGSIDEDLTFITYYTDFDQDGFGVGTGTSLCSNPGAGFSTVLGDCNDNDATVHVTSPYFVDGDNDTYGAGSAVQLCSASAPAGYSVNSTDCNDANAAINPSATEVCNNIDDNCNGSIDEGLTFVTYYVDGDGDGFGAGSGTSLCSNPGAGFSLNNTDCNDANSAINPNAVEVCNGIDDNCNGTADEGLTLFTFYRDFDGDGFGNPLVSSSTCFTTLAGYVANNTDCNDNDATAHSLTTYFVDGDNDGFGSTSTADLCSSTAPAGYSTNSNDCDDNNANIHAPVSYFIDNDHDGFGSTTSALVCSETAPVGFSTNSNDCNDNDASVHALQSYYVDADGDGFGSSTTALLCSSTAPVGYAVLNSDCNDNDATVHSLQPYFVDADLDGFGSTTVAMLCSSVATSGYSTNNTDCNDNDASVNTPQPYYVDADGDTYGAGSVVSLCSSTAPAGYSVNNTDCNDNNAAINPGASEVCNGIDDNCNGSVDEGLTFATYYQDVDGDGFGGLNTISTCNGAPSGYVSNNTDCNDNDATVHTPQPYYADVDGDGYGAGPVVLLCSSTAPNGYSVNNTDCNDGNANIYPTANEQCNNIDDNCDGLIDNGVVTSTFYQDADNDGVGNAAVSVVACAAPVGYVLQSGDCNDNDASVQTPQPYYVDADGDTYGAGSVVLLCSSTAPTGYSVNNTDCNDASASVHPGAAEVCNGIDDNCDGSIDEGLTFVTYYVDADGDGFGAGVGTSLCSNPGAGYVTNNTDCNDNDATVNTPQPYYLDADGDGYGAGSVVSFCSSTAPLSYSVNNTDCNDGAAAINPGATEVCNGIDDNCNGSVDEGLTFVTYYVDADGDGFGAGVGTSLCSNPGAGYSLDNTDCNDNDASVHAPQSYFVDADGDGFGSTTTALVCSSTATAGYSTNNTDCNDANAAINPSATEVCNGIDDNCNGSIDEGLTFVVYYADLDGDTYGNFANSVSTCNGAPVGYVLNSGDCNDAVAAINPGATEICANGIDDNCNGSVDEGCTAGCTNAPTANAGTGSSICNGSTIALNGSIGGGATNGTWSGGSGNFQNASVLNTVYTPSSADYLAGSVTLTLTTDAPVGCTAAVSTVTYTFTALPSPIGAISGPSSLCNPSTAATFTYSVAPVAGITTYTWSVPANTTIVSGQGTTSLVVKWSALAIHNGVAGLVSVVGNNSNGCGTAIPSTLGISIQLQVPVTPPSISGTQAVCPGDVVTYSIALVARADNYTWSVPAGAQILSGQGSNMISVQYNGAFVGGNMSVTANNGCGSSPARLQALVRNVLPASASITGPVNGVCNLNGVVFTAASITGASSYLWTVPAGASIVGSASGSSITVNFGTISSGAVTVAGVNNCGAGAVRSLTITGTPGQPGLISGPSSVCVGQPALYSVNTVAGAATYSWTVSSRLSITSGQGTKNLTVSGVATGTNVTVNVTAGNACGVSPVRVLAGITVAICPRVGAEAGALSLTAYPNPVSDVLNVSFNSEKSQDYTVRMLDATGRIVMADAKTASEGENKVEMSVKGLASGIYMLQFNMGDHTEQMRIYVN
jgi:hypothetical protein